MWTVIDSPVGELRLVEHDGAITAIEFAPFRDRDGRPRGDRDDDAPGAASRPRASCAAYFARDLKEFDLPLAPVGSDLPAAGLGSSCARSATARPRRTARSPTGSA